jgi:DNA ligase (NAD+)
MDTEKLSLRTTYFLTTSSHDEQFVRTHIAELRIIIEAHNNLYYHTADPIISDAEYDQLFALLVERERNFPDLLIAQSPTQRLIGQVMEWFVSASHLAEMSSLQNTYSAKEIAKRDEWVRRIQKKHDLQERTYIVEPKLDGMAVELVYLYGQFTRAVTRGDGQVGEDITEHAKQLIGLPLVIEKISHIECISFRGEIVLSKNAFARLEGMLTSSWSTFANARNATAGTLRHLDTSLVKKRWLSVFVYDILYVQWTLDCTTAEEQFDLFLDWWLPFLNWMSIFANIQQVMDRCSSPTTKQQADEQSIDLDGLVIKVQEFAVRERLWSTNHHPKRAIAYKFPAQQVATKLEEVSFQVGRTGVLTPVAHLTPVLLSGVTISRASLHNRSFIQERWLKQGDRVLLQRSGEVIPYIVAGLPQRRDGSQKPINLPTHCPVCAHAVYLDDRALTLWCGNVACDAQLKQRLQHAVSKSALDMSWCWPSLIESIVDAWLVATIADLFVLWTNENKQLLRSLPGIAEKKIASREKEITQKLPYPLWRVINALGIRHIWEVSSADIARHYFLMSEEKTRNMGNFIAFCTQELLLEQIDGIGKEMIASLQLFFTDPENSKLLHRLDDLWVIDRWERWVSPTSWPLKDLHIVITGSFALPRDEIVSELHLWGATVQTAINKQTDLLLAGEWWWSKRSIAKSLNIPIMQLDTFAEKFWVSSLLSPGAWDASIEQNAWVIQQSSLF